MSQREKSLRAKMATEYRRKNPDAERITAARRELAAQQIRDYITRITEAAPPLTGEQRRELAGLLLVGGGLDDAA